MAETLERVVCLRQIGQEIMNPEIKILRWSNDNSLGNCSTCIYDPKNNQKCNNGYTPVRSYSFHVMENE